MDDLGRAGMDPFAFHYLNWRGEAAVRRAYPASVRFGATDWHPEEQWLMLAKDAEKGADREFAMRDMTPVGAEGLLSSIAVLTPPPGHGATRPFSFIHRGPAPGLVPVHRLVVPSAVEWRSKRRRWALVALDLTECAARDFDLVDVAPLR